MAAVPGQTQEDYIMAKRPTLVVALWTLGEDLSWAPKAWCSEQTSVKPSDLNSFEPGPSFPKGDNANDTFL